MANPEDLKFKIVEADYLPADIVLMTDKLNGAAILNFKTGTIKIVSKEEMNKVQNMVFEEFMKIFPEMR